MKGLLKRFKVFPIILCAAFLGISIVSYAAITGSNIPSALWNLYVTDQMVSQGILTDWTNHQGHYPYQAYINGYKLYSNYTFIPQGQYRFVFSGNEIYSVNQSYSIGMTSTYYGTTYTYNVPASDTGFYRNYCALGQYLPGNAYFFIDGTATGAEVSISGQMTTY